MKKNNHGIEFLKKETKPEEKDHMTKVAIIALIALLLFMVLLLGPCQQIEDDKTEEPTIRINDKHPITAEIVKYINKGEESQYIKEVDAN
ncbi:MAG: hypothetical protein GY861_09065 [bacterium]|nr:hypothetical protein [bacterium]